MRQQTAVAAGVLAALLAIAPAHAGATTICFFGADLDQDKAKDFAKGIGEDLKKTGAKSSFGTDIAGDAIFETMKTADGTCFNAMTGKFECNGGVLLVYISAHGGFTEDGNDTVIGNADPAKPGTTTVSALAAAIAGAIPDCCTVVFAFDACAANAWFDTYIKPADNGDVNPQNPFRELNWLVAVPNIGAADGRCIGTPVGDALKKALAGKPLTISELALFFDAQGGVQRSYSVDEDHDYLLAAPEPGTALTVALGCSALLMRRCRRAKFRASRSSSR